MPRRDNAGSRTLVISTSVVASKRANTVRRLALQIQDQIALAAVETEIGRRLPVTSPGPR